MAAAATSSSSAFQSSQKQNQRRCVFVGNIPYDTTEEQLIQICEEVGPVVSFRLVIDRETGKPKGYGFCEYKDEETALSARRNLQSYEINGRQLRVDFADNDKNGDKSREQGRGGPGMVMNVDPQRQSGGPAVLGDSGIDQPMGVSVAINAAIAMARALGAAQNGSFSTSFGNQSQQPLGSDQLTLHLAKMSRHQLLEIMSELKAMAAQDKEQAHQLLLAVPNLLKAIFQAQIMLGMVAQQMLLTPSICKVAAPPVQPVSLDARQNQEAQTGPGVPPHPLLAQSQGLQHGQLPLQSAVLTLPTIQPEPLGNPSVRPLAQAQHSLALKPQVSVPLSQHVGQTTVSGYGSQMPASTQSLLSDHGFQTGKLVNYSSDQINFPSKLVRMDDGRRVAPSLDVAMASSVAVHPPTGIQISKSDSAANSAKQVSQVQLPVEMEPALLQQVLSLTPEQLKSLPSDQQQQVIQLQQLLHQSTQM